MMGLRLWGTDMGFNPVALGFSHRNWQKVEWSGQGHGLCNPSLQIRADNIFALRATFLTHFPHKLVMRTSGLMAACPCPQHMKELRSVGILIFHFFMSLSSRLG